MSEIEHELEQGQTAASLGILPGLMCFIFIYLFIKIFLSCHSEELKANIIGIKM